MKASALWYGLLERLNRLFKTGNRRFEFERKYREGGDYFGYETKTYEHAKYAGTLKRVLDWRGGRGAALEIGCSVGVFTRQIAAEFDSVTAQDLSHEALRLAGEALKDLKNVRYAEGDLLTLDLGETYDAIFCAEVLYYIRETEGPRVCAALEKHLKPDGLIIEVGPASRPSGEKYFHHWDRVLGAHFAIVHRETIDDPARPWEIVAYAKHSPG